VDLASNYSGHFDDEFYIVAVSRGWQIAEPI
jgi:hypothetical protein